MLMPERPLVTVLKLHLQWLLDMRVTRLRLFHCMAYGIHRANFTVTSLYGRVAIADVCPNHPCMVFDRRMGKSKEQSPKKNYVTNFNYVAHGFRSPTE